MYDSDDLGAIRGLLFAVALYLAGGLLWLLVRWIGWAGLSTPDVICLSGWFAMGLAVRRAVRARI